MTERPDVQELFAEVPWTDLSGALAASMGWPAGSVLVDDGSFPALALGCCAQFRLVAGSVQPVFASRAQVPVTVIASTTLMPVASYRNPIRPMSLVPAVNAAPSSAVAHRRVRVRSGARRGGATARRGARRTHLRRGALRSGASRSGPNDPPAPDALPAARGPVRDRGAS